MPWEEDLPDEPDDMVDLLRSLVQFDPAERPNAADALRHSWLAPLHDEDDLESTPPRCEFPFEACDLNLDHFLLAGLDAVRAAHADYPTRIPEMLRFGIMHNRSVALKAEEAEEAARWDDGTSADGAGGAAPACAPAEGRGTAEPEPESGPAAGD